MDNSRGTNPVFNRGEHLASRRRLHLSSTDECTDWLQDQLCKQSAKEISDKTGQGTRSAEAVKLGRNGLTMAHLVSMCRADDVFRAKFFEFCGGKLEGSPAQYAAIAAAIRAANAQGDGE